VREKDYSEETAREIDVAVKQLIDDAYARAKALLCERRALLDQGARLLLDKETLTPEDFPPLTQSNEPPVKEKVKESA
jgi:cell division protease FtsH